MLAKVQHSHNHCTHDKCCKMVNPKYAAVSAAVYTLNISILVVLLYSWRISLNMKKYSSLEDVYYGVQFAYFAIIGTQLFMICLSIMLLIGIYKENASLIIPWAIGFIAFMALESVSVVYSNVLRDHVNKQFDSLCEAEMLFFFTRVFFNVIAIRFVIKFVNLLRLGISWKGPEIIEL